jgi:hypothetical protein
MAITFGVVQFERPSKPQSADAVNELLSLAGKDIIRLAWSSLAPDVGGYIQQNALAVWFCQVFNLESDCGNGTQCIYLLKSLGLLKSHDHVNRYKPRFEL